MLNISVLFAGLSNFFNLDYFKVVFCIIYEFLKVQNTTFFGLKKFKTLFEL